MTFVNVAVCTNKKTISHFPQFLLKALRLSHISDLVRCVRHVKTLCSFAQPAPRVPSSEQSGSLQMAYTDGGYTVTSAAVGRPHVQCIRPPAAPHSYHTSARLQFGPKMARRDAARTGSPASSRPIDAPKSRVRYTQSLSHGTPPTRSLGRHGR